jgi:hypothetical protein
MALPDFINNWVTVVLNAIVSFKVPLIFILVFFITPIRSWLKGIFSSERDKFGKDGIAFITALAFAFIGIFLSDSISILLSESGVDVVETAESIIHEPLKIIFELSLLYLGYISGEAYWKLQSHRDSCPADIIGNDILYKEIEKEIGKPEVVDKIEELYGICRYNYFKESLEEKICGEDVRSHVGSVVIAAGTPLQFKDALDKIIANNMKKSFYTTNIFPPRYWIRGDPLFNWANSAYVISWENIDKQGEDRTRLIKFIIEYNPQLTENNVEIKKIDKIYSISFGSTSFELKLNDKGNVVCLKENGSIIDSFKVEKDNIYLIKSEEKTRLINFLDELKNKDYQIDPSTINYVRESDNTILKLDFVIHQVNDNDKLKQYFIFSHMQEGNGRDYVSLATKPNLIDGDVHLCLKGGIVYTGMLDQLDFFKRFFDIIKEKNEKDKEFIISRILVTDVYNTDLDWRSEHGDVVTELVDSYGPRVENKNVTRIISLSEVKARYYGEIMIFDKKIAIIYDVNSEGVPFGKKYGRIQIIYGKSIINELVRIFEETGNFKTPETFWPTIYKSQVKK